MSEKHASHVRIHALVPKPKMASFQGESEICAPDFTFEARFESFMTEASSVIFVSDWTPGLVVSCTNCSRKANLAPNRSGAVTPWSAGHHFVSRERKFVADSSELCVDRGGYPGPQTIVRPRKGAFRTIV